MTHFEDNNNEYTGNYKTVDSNIYNKKSLFVI